MEETFMGKSRLSLLGMIAVAAIGVATAAGCGATSGFAPISHSDTASRAIDDHAQPVTPDVKGAPTPQPSPPTIFTSPGKIRGLDDQFSPVDGDTLTGGSGQPIDGITCQKTMSNNYHVHVYVGIYVNGVHYALPDTIGMKHPQIEPPDGFTKYANCFYDLHTHDASGYVHVESIDPNHVPIQGTIYTLQNLFDVWGITVNANQVGQFTGPVQVVTSGQVYRGGPDNAVVYRSMYSTWTGDPNTIPLYSHEVIFLMVGPTYPTILPNVVFYSEY
jgi:hypothetical protein